MLPSASPLTALLHTISAKSHLHFSIPPPLLHSAPAANIPPHPAEHLHLWSLERVFHVTPLNSGKLRLTSGSS